MFVAEIFSLWHWSYEVKCSNAVQQPHKRPADSLEPPQNSCTLPQHTYRYIDLAHRESFSILEVY
jgi:hypothetical protein